MLLLGRPKYRELGSFGEVVLLNLSILEGDGIEVIELLTYRVMEGLDVGETSILQLHELHLHVMQVVH
jgi:hypothetical protein